MHGVLGRGEDAQIDDPRPTALDEDNSSKVTVASHEDSPLFVGDAK